MGFAGKVVGTDHENARAELELSQKLQPVSIGISRSGTTDVNLRVTVGSMLKFGLLK